MQQFVPPPLGGCLGDCSAAAGPNIRSEACMEGARTRHGRAACAPVDARLLRLLRGLKCRAEGSSTRWGFGGGGSCFQTFHFPLLSESPPGGAARPFTADNAPLRSSERTCPAAAGGGGWGGGAHLHLKTQPLLSAAPEQQPHLHLITPGTTSPSKGPFTAAPTRGFPLLMEDGGRGGRTKTLVHLEGKNGQRRDMLTA